MDELTQQQQTEESIDIREYLRVLTRRKWIIITFFVVTVVTVTIGTFLQTPIYRATATLLIDMPAKDVVTISNENAVLDSPGYTAYREYYQTQLEILKSASIAKQVLADLGLSANPDFAQAKDPVGAFTGRIKTEPIRDTRMAKVSFDDKDKELATRVVNYLATVYTQKNLAYIAAGENLNLLKNEYIKLQSMYSEYSKRYKDSYPRMARLKQELEQMNKRISEESQSPSMPVNVRANNVKVVDFADIPINPVKPKKKLNILLSMIMGLFGGVGLAFLFENMDNTLKTPDDVERFVKYPFLGYVPIIISKNGALSEVDKDRYVLIDPRSNVSEAYRSIRTSIICAVPQEKSLKSIVVSSPNPQEGKTITLCNIGITMANAGEKILLVDADLRKPRLHKAFGIKNESGLVDYLTRGVDFSDLLRKTEVPNVFAITCGPHPSNPAELLGSRKMKEFIDEASKRFDRVFIDSPPMAPFTDAVLLSRAADGVILVVRCEATRRTIIPRVKQVLSDVSANVLGVIINSVTSQRHGGYYYYNYYHSYYYDDKEQDGDKDNDDT